MATSFRWTRGHWRIGRPPSRRLGVRASSARKARDGTPEWRRRSSTPRARSPASVSRMDTKRPRARAAVPMGASTRISFTFAVAIQSETFAPPIAFWTSSS